jgi:hypothetical protein
MIARIAGIQGRLILMYPKSVKIQIIANSNNMTASAGNFVRAMIVSVISTF